MTETKKRMGRPPGTGEGRGKKFSVMLTDEVFESIQRYADEDKIPDSTWAFRVLRDAVVRRDRRGKSKTEPTT